MLPKFLPTVHIFSFTILTYLKKFIANKSLNAKQCPAGLSPRIIPLSCILPLAKNCLSFNLALLPPPGVHCSVPSPTLFGKPWGRGENST